MTISDVKTTTETRMHKTLEALKVELFGKKGAITAQLKSLGALTPDERKAAGARINAVRDEIGAAFAARKADLDRLEGEGCDGVINCSRKP